MPDGQWEEDGKLIIAKGGMCNILTPDKNVVDLTGPCQEGYEKVGTACLATSTISISGTVAVNEVFNAVTVSVYSDSKVVKRIELTNASKGSTVSFALNDLTAGTYTLKARGYIGIGNCNDGIKVQSGERCDNHAGTDFDTSSLDTAAETTSAVISKTTSAISLNLGEPPLIISGDISAFFPGLELIWMTVSSKNAPPNVFFGNGIQLL